MLKRINLYYLIIFPVFIIIFSLGILSERGKYLQKVVNLIGFINRNSAQVKTMEVYESVLLKEHYGKLKLFVLAGQSNMSGMGDLPKLEEPVNSKVYVFGNDYRWRLAKEPIDDPTHQVDVVSEDKSAGFGPSVPFATALLEHYPTEIIGLIPCAKGGSLIHEWRRDLGENTLYGSCLKRVRAASVMGNVAGLLYFQGEIDSVDPRENHQRIYSPHQWADKFEVFIKNWRTDLDLTELPVIFAQIGTNTEPNRFKNWLVVKQQQEKVRLPFSAMIKTDDLTLRDSVHFTTESYKIIGKRFANAYLDLLADKNMSKKINTSSSTISP